MPELVIAFDPVSGKVDEYHACHAKPLRTSTEVSLLESELLGPPVISTPACLYPTTTQTKRPFVIGRPIQSDYFLQCDFTGPIWRQRIAKHHVVRNSIFIATGSAWPQSVSALEEELLLLPAAYNQGGALLGPWFATVFV